MKIQLLLILSVGIGISIVNAKTDKKIETTVVKKMDQESVVTLTPTSAAKAASATDSAFYGFTVKNAKNEDVKLSDYKGKVVLVVNVASKCGYTNQYEGLQKLYTDYAAKDFVILGFPSNQFFGQEPGTNQEIQEFCKLSYGVTFPVFAKVDVNGSDAIPLYKWLTSQKNFSGRITWNFNKFLINKNGEVVQRFGSKQTPAEIEPEVKKLLQ